MNEQLPEIPTEPPLDELPDPHLSLNMIGEVLPEDWTPDGDS